MYFPFSSLILTHNSAIVSDRLSKPGNPISVTQGLAEWERGRALDKYCLYVNNPGTQFFFPHVVTQFQQRFFFFATFTVMLWLPSAVYCCTSV